MTATPAPWVYVATAEPFDDEMTARIAEHRARRGEQWRTVEAPLDLAGAIEGAPAGAAVLVDCLTLWLNNLMFNDRDIDAETARLEAALAARQGPVVLVSNEVGSGIVPDNARGAALPRSAGPAQSADRSARRSCRAAGRGLADGGEGMSRRNRRDRGRAPSRQDGEAQGRAGRRGRGQEDREGPADRPHRHRQRQVDGGVRAGAAHARPRQADRRGAVHQGRLAVGRARRASRRSAIRWCGTPWAKASPGTPRT